LSGGCIALQHGVGLRDIGVNIHFKCTQCGKCCRDTKIPLTVAEAIKWLNRGHDVQLLCEASPWPTAMDSDPRALHFKRRSFAAMSGSMPTRVVVMLVANVVGACPNLLADNRCGIYEDRPLVCRIYPAEINPFVALKPENKACPPEAWTKDHPMLQHRGALTDEVIRRDIESCRAADALDADLKRRLCLALNIVDTALVHEAMLVYSLTANTLLSGLASAIATDSGHDPASQWTFVSNQPDTLATLAKSGAIALHRRDTEAASFQLFGFKRDAIFGLNAHRDPP
jgi:Fe-S-cluster containining protein